MEECLTYFRLAAFKPDAVPKWAEWWEVNEDRVRELFPRVEYLRLKARGANAAEDYLLRTGQLKEPIRLDPEFIRDLRTINWLSNCGQPIPVELASLVMTCSANDVVMIARHPQTVQFRQGQSVELYNRSRAGDYPYSVQWNDRARAVGDWLDNSDFVGLWSKRLTALGVDTSLVSTIRTDFLFAWLHHEHRFISGVPDDHAKWFKWYRLGRIVCGGSGTWPNGSLVVF